MTFTLPHSLTLATAGTIRTSLLRALEQDAAVVLDGSGVAEIDAAGLQVLCAAARSAAARGGALRLPREGRSAALGAAIFRAGLGAERWAEEERHG